jgi:hypothetical protein
MTVTQTLLDKVDNYNLYFTGITDATRLTTDWTTILWNGDPVYLTHPSGAGPWNHEPGYIAAAFRMNSLPKMYQAWFGSGYQAWKSNRTDAFQANIPSGGIFVPVHPNSGVEFTTNSLTMLVIVFTVTDTSLFDAFYTTHITPTNLIVDSNLSTEGVVSEGTVFAYDKRLFALKVDDTTAGTTFYNTYVSQGSGMNVDLAYILRP